MKALLITAIFIFSLIAHAQENNDKKIFFETFVKAQNDHDLQAVGELLSDSPDFLWITKGNAIWGKEAALKKFEALYKGTWQLEPVPAEFKVKLLSAKSWQIFVPIIFNIGEPGQEAKKTRFLMNMVLVKESGKLKISSILPIQSLVQP